jgi:hypothetical protein
MILPCAAIVWIGDEARLPLAGGEQGKSQNVRGKTRPGENKRLATIHALARFIALPAPELVDWSGQVQSVPFKVWRARNDVIAFLRTLSLGFQPRTISSRHFGPESCLSRVV